MNLDSFKQEVNTIIELERLNCQILWSDAFHSDGTLTNSLALQEAVALMHSSLTRELSLIELDELNPSSEEISFIFRLLK